MESQIVNLHSLFNDFYDRGALKITLLTQQLGARWRAIARLKNEALDNQKMVRDSDSEVNDFDWF